MLAATSNPEGARLQAARVGELSVAADVLATLEAANRVQLSPGGKLGPFGAVIGATVDLKSMGLDRLLTDSDYATPILAPGFGFQGARLDSVNGLFGSASRAVIASVSRSVLAAGTTGIRLAIEQSNQQLREGLEIGQA